VPPAAWSTGGGAAVRDAVLEVVRSRRGLRSSPPVRCPRAARRAAAVPSGGGGRTSALAGAGSGRSRTSAVLHGGRAGASRNQATAASTAATTTALYKAPSREPFPAFPGSDRCRPSRPVEPCGVARSRAHGIAQRSSRSGTARGWAGAAAAGAAATNADGRGAFKTPPPPPLPGRAARIRCPTRFRRAWELLRVRGACHHAPATTWSSGLLIRAAASKAISQTQARKRMSARVSTMANSGGRRAGDSCRPGLAQQRAPRRGSCLRAGLGAGSTSTMAMPRSG